MNKLLLLSVIAWLGIACDSPAVDDAGANRSNLSASNTKANAIPYSQTENAYTFAQISDLADGLTPSGKEAREIVGKTVTESKLWDNKFLETRLRKLMGTDYATMKKFWNTETPIRKFGDFLMMTGCEQHNCADNQYVIFMDLGDGRINVVHISKDATKEWYGYREIDDLPPPFAEALAAMKKLNTEE